MVKVLIEDSLKRNGPKSVAEAVKALNDWKGLVIGKSDAQDYKNHYIMDVFVRMHDRAVSRRIQVQKSDRVSLGIQNE